MKKYISLFALSVSIAGLGYYGLLYYNTYKSNREIENTCNLIEAGQSYSKVESIVKENSSVKMESINHSEIKRKILIFAKVDPLNMTDKLCVVFAENNEVLSSEFTDWPDNMKTKGEWPGE